MRMLWGWERAKGRPEWKAGWSPKCLWPLSWRQHRTTDDRQLVFLGRFSETLLKRVALTKAALWFPVVRNKFLASNQRKSCFSSLNRLKEINLALPHIFHQSKIQVDQRLKYWKKWSHKVLLENMRIVLISKWAKLSQEWCTLRKSKRDKCIWLHKTKRKEKQPHCKKTPYAK